MYFVYPATTYTPNTYLHSNNWFAAKMRLQIHEFKWDEASFCIRQFSSRWMEGKVLWYVDSYAIYRFAKFALSKLHRTMKSTATTTTQQNGTHHCKQSWMVYVNVCSVSYESQPIHKCTSPTHRQYIDRFSDSSSNDCHVKFFSSLSRVAVTPHFTIEFDLSGNGNNNNVPLILFKLFW